jgi:hypothetical protein
MPIRLAAIVSALLTVSPLALAADPFVGTWKLIKSTQTNRHLGTILKFEEGSKEALREVRQDGRNPWSASMTPAEAECRQVSRPNGVTANFIYSRNGKDVATLKRKISAGGRLLTETIDGVTPKGGKFHGIDVYEKQ